MAQREFVMLVSVVFAATALVLAVVGVHGGIAQRIADRRMEFAIRAALGATGCRLRWLAARGELAPVLIGVGVGAAGSYALASLLEATVYGVNPKSLEAYVATGALLVMTAAIATVTATWKVNRLDIVAVLKR